jgi:hypothetical protein
MPKNKIKANVLRVMVLLPLISASSATLKEMNATDTRICQFTGDKNGSRQNVFTS